MYFKTKASVTAISLALAGCLTSTSSGTATGPTVGSSAPPVAQVPSPTPTPTPTPSPSPAPVPAPTGSPYEREPNIATCDPGILKDGEKQFALQTLNQMRALHGLSAVTYDAASDAITRQSALLGVANQALNHNPPASWTCYTQDGFTGSSQSNLYLRFTGNGSQVSSASALGSLLVDNGVETLGHRRWMLHPFLGTTSLGRVDGTPPGSPYFYTGISLKVVGGAAPDVANTQAARNGFIAYPQGDYPSIWFEHGWSMSFSVFANLSSAFANDARAISYAFARVAISDASGNALPVTNLKADYTGFGLPNVLYWQVPGTQNNQTYTVRITGVVVNGGDRDYSYTFRVTQ